MLSAKSGPILLTTCVVTSPGLAQVSIPQVVAIVSLERKAANSAMLWVVVKALRWLLSKMWPMHFHVNICVPPTNSVHGGLIRMMPQNLVCLLSAVTGFNLTSIAPGLNVSMAKRIVQMMVYTAHFL